MHHLMLDLETMGTASDAAIVAIGAVFFDADTNQLGEEFYTAVDLSSCLNADMSINGDTVYWWLKQSQNANSAILETPIHINVALLNFSEFVYNNENKETINVWGNGASFDNVILSNAFKAAKLTQPWKWWNDRCYRTIAAMFPMVQKPQPAIAHHALHDAKAQAQHMLEISKHFKGDL